MQVLTPSTPAEFAEALCEAASNRRIVRLEGAGTKDAWGGTPREDGVRVSTRRLTRVIQYEPHDLTISVESGLHFNDLAALLREHRQMVPLDPPLAGQATVGGVLATNLCGPRRRLYGSARDMVIGMTFATLEGSLVKTGGMVVKNVAGLDVQKLMIGSYGTLAAITSVNFKLAPAPEATRTFALSFHSTHEAAAARDDVLRSVLQPAAVDVLNPEASKRCGLSGYALLVRAGGSARVLERYAREFDGAEAYEGAREDALWQSITDFTPAYLGEHPEGGMVRVGHALDALEAVMEQARGAVVARAGSGVSLIHGEEVAELSRLAGKLAERGWSAVVEAAPPARKSHLTLWPEPGDALDVMLRMKAMFDPHNLLNPGRLHGRL